MLERALRVAAMEVADAQVGVGQREPGRGRGLEVGQGLLEAAQFDERGAEAVVRDGLLGRSSTAMAKSRAAASRSPLRSAHSPSSSSRPALCS